MTDATTLTEAGRLRAARTENYPSASDAARAHDWNVNTYIGHENGSRPLSREAAERYAAAFSITLDWLLAGKGPMRHLQTAAEASP